MIDGKRVLAIVPARGGSRSIPKKNLAQLAGKSLLAWTAAAIEEARPLIDFAICSTDDEAIADEARRCSLDVPFMRPDSLATDTAVGYDVFTHALEWAKGPDSPYPFEIAFYLQPTSPLRIGLDLLRAAHIYQGDPAIRGVTSVCPCEHPPLWSGILHGGDGASMASFIPQLVLRMNRQDMPQYYRLNGAVYLTEIDYAFSRGEFTGPATAAYIMPPERSIDIDDRISLALCEVMLNQRKERNPG